MSGGSTFNRVALTVEERETLKDARDRRKLKRLADALGVTARTVQAWERGERSPTSAQLAAWWKAVGP